jgi:serine O-acetyltransferase
MTSRDADAAAPSHEALWREIRSRHPGLREALVADARVTARYRGERHEFHGRLDVAVQMLRLAWVSDAFLAQALYRLKARLQALGVPILPRLAHRLAMTLAQVSIGDPVVIHPGVYIVHGQVVADGLVEIHPGVTLFPWVTIGLRAGDVRGATIERDVSVGTGAKLIGEVHVGAGARIGANAVVVDDVPAGVTVVGAPARAVRSAPSAA